MLRTAGGCSSAFRSPVPRVLSGARHTLIASSALLRSTHAAPFRAHVHNVPPSAVAATSLKSLSKHVQDAQRVQPDVSHEHVDAQTPSVFCFFENATASWQYILVDPTTLEAAIIDPVLDYDPASGSISTKTADVLLAYVEQNGLHVSRILETHAHADHLTSSYYLKSQLAGNVPVGIGKRITQVQDTFAPIYGFDDPGVFVNVFDQYFEDDERFRLGTYECRVIHLPGHTPDHIGYVFGSAIFTGDSIFNPDVGSARADFPGGNAADLYASMQRLLSLPQDSLLFVGHDYPPGNARSPATSLTVKDHRNAWEGKDEDIFIDWRQKRDATLGTPSLLHPSLQVNIRGGRLPPKDEQGRLWFKTPIRIPPEFV